LLISFTLKLKNSQVLKVVIETLADIIDEAEFKVTPAEFSVSLLDNSQVSLSIFSIKKKNFDEFKCSQQSRVRLNLDDLNMILKRSAPDDPIELHFDEKDQKILIKMQKEGGSMRCTFGLSALEAKFEKLPFEHVVKRKYAASWVMSPEYFLEAVKAAQIYSEYVNIMAIKDEGLFFSSTGKIGEMEYSLSLDDLLDANISESCGGVYSTFHLKSILNLSSITEKLEIFLRTDHPLKMKFNLLEGGEFIYFVAPLVEEKFFEDDEEDY